MRILDRGIVFDATTAAREARFCSFTSLLRLSDGGLMAAFRTGSAKDSPDESVRIVLSDDDGQTWQTVTAGFGTIPPGGGRIRTAGPAEIAAGRIMASFSWIDRSDPTLPLANPTTQGILPARILVAESEDAGRSWGAFRQVPMHPHRGTTPTGELLVLADGTLALPYEAWKDYDDASPGQHHAALRLSEDGGQTWSGPVIVAHDPRGRVLYWDQRLAVNPEDGHLVALFWTHDRQAGRDLPIHIAWGTADARAWSDPVSTGIDGQICAPVWLPGGRLFAAYVHRHDPPSIRAVLSNDGGHSWAAAGELILYQKRRGGSESGMSGSRDFGDYWADMSIWTFGHPAAVRLSGRDVMVAYYAGDAAAMSVHWARVRVSDD